MRITMKLLLILALTSTPAVAANLFVPGQFATIQDAVDASSPGDRILVGAGEYVGALIATRVKIIGEGDQTVIVSGPNNQGGCCLWFQNGFRIDAGGDGTILRDMRVDLVAGLVDPGAFPLIQVGVFGLGANSVSVRGLTFVGLNSGVDFRGGNNWSVTKNTIEGLVPETFRRAIGIRAAGTSGSFVGFNTITHDGSGDDNSSLRFRGIQLLCFFCGVTVENNKLIQNEIGIDAPGAFEITEISIFDQSALLGGPIDVFNNKIIQNDADPIIFTPPELVDHNVLN